MKQSVQKVAAWQKAHPHLKIPEDVLATCGPWPSLEVSDFLVWAREQEDIPKIVIQIVEQLASECAWAYDMWAKIAATDAQKLMIDLLRSTDQSPEYNFTQRFLQDFAKAHGMYTDVAQQETPPPWRQAAETGAPSQPPKAAE